MQTHTNTKQQRRLLSEFLVQLIFICESGRGYNCSHVDWREGERRTREGREGEERLKLAGRRRREEGEGEKPCCSNKDLLL